MRVVYIVFLIFFLGGCATKKESVAEVNIEIENLALNVKAKECKQKSLKISQAFAPMSISSHNMSYVDESGKIYKYNQTKWQESPSNILTEQILQNIRESHLFSSTLLSKSRSKSDYTLEINIEDFMQYFQNNSSFVKVSYTLTLIDTKTNQVISTKNFFIKVDAKALSAKGGVDAFEAALKELFVKNIEWLDEVCR